MGFAKCE